MRRRACACRGGSGHVVSELRPPCPPLARRELACARVVWRPGRYYRAPLPGRGTRVATCGASEVRCVPWGGVGMGPDYGGARCSRSALCRARAAAVRRVCRRAHAASVHGACMERAVRAQRGGLWRHLEASQVEVARPGVSPLPRSPDRLCRCRHGCGRRHRWWARGRRGAPRLLAGRRRHRLSRLSHGRCPPGAPLAAQRIR